MIDYNIFPYWLGINSFGELILAFICFLLLFYIYILFGYVFCPNSLKNRLSRLIFILFWPLIIVLRILSFPFYMLYEFTKSPNKIEKEMNKWIKENK